MQSIQIELLSSQARLVVENQPKYLNCTRRCSDKWARSVLPHSCHSTRRISAIGLSERVANERADRVTDAKLGWKCCRIPIRLENKISDATRITFCTTGILLRRLEDSSNGVGNGIDDVSHVFVDEVHERSLDSDFLLMVLRDLLAIRHDLRLVMMSATLNADLFSSYFNDARVCTYPDVHSGQGLILGGCTCSNQL
ncbi:hypothetical protein BC829DRAFT_480754 [Chytridium lagenaria]|nr:hypothetical protein BC829DRAFT_480754 [Chytridium lagenaria]